MPVQEALGKDICLVNCVFCDSPKKRVFLWECCPLSFIAIPWGKHGDFGGFCCHCRLQSLQGGAPVDQIDKLTHILISGWCLVAHPTARKWVSSPHFFELINSIYPIITGVITHLLSRVIHQVGCFLDQDCYLVGGFELPTPLKNDGVHQLGLWNSQLFLESH